MVIKSSYYNIQRPLLLEKNFIEKNINSIKYQCHSHLERNKVLLTEPSSYSRESKLVKLCNSSQLFKEENKAKVNEIIGNLLYPQYELLNADVVYHKPISCNEYYNAIDQRKTILNKILMHNINQSNLMSFNKDVAYLGTKRDQNNLLKEINEYEMKKIYSNIKSLSFLSPKAKSFEWMFQLKPKKIKQKIEVRAGDGSINLYKIQ